MYTVQCTLLYTDIWISCEVLFQKVYTFNHNREWKNKRNERKQEKRKCWTIGLNCNQYKKNIVLRFSWTLNHFDSNSLTRLCRMCYFRKLKFVFVFNLASVLVQSKWMNGWMNDWMNEWVRAYGCCCMCVVVKCVIHLIAHLKNGWSRHRMMIQKWTFCSIPAGPSPPFHSTPCVFFRSAIA